MTARTVEQTTKDWGTVRTLFNRGDTRVTLIDGPRKDRNEVCSEHVHAYTHNLFFVLQGSLEVHCCNRGVWSNNLLQPGESFLVPAGMWHYFRILEDPTQAIEIYWSDSMEKDIERRNDGSN